MSPSRIKIGIFLPYTNNLNQYISFSDLSNKNSIPKIVSIYEKKDSENSDFDENLNKNGNTTLKISSLSKSIAKYLYFSINSIPKIQAYMVKIFEPENFITEKGYLDSSIDSFWENSENLELDFIIIFSVKIRGNMLTIKLSLISKDRDSKILNWNYLYNFAELKDFYTKTVSDILSEIKYPKNIEPFTPTLLQIVQLAEIIDEEDFFFSSKKERSFIKKLSQLYVKEGDPLIFQYILEKLVFSDNIFFQNEIVEILEKNGSTPHFAIMMALFFMKKKNYNEAEKYFQKAKKELPNNDLIWQIGAEILLLSGKIKEAKKAIIKAVELNPLQLKTIELFVEISFSENEDLSVVFDYFLKKIPDFLKKQLFESPKIVFITAKNHFQQKDFKKALNLIEPIIDKNEDYYIFYIKTLLSLKEYSKIYQVLQNSDFEKLKNFKNGFNFFYKKSGEKISFLQKISNESDFNNISMFETGEIDESFFNNYLLTILKEIPIKILVQSREIEAILWLLLEENQKAVEILYNQPSSFIKDLTLGLLFYIRYDAKHKGVQFIKKMISFEFSLSLIIMFHFNEKNLFRLWFYLKKRQHIIKIKDFFQLYFDIKLNIEIGNIQKGYRLFKSFKEIQKPPQKNMNSKDIYQTDSIVEIKNSNDFDFDKFINKKLLENLGIFSEKATLLLEIDLEYLMKSYDSVIQKIQKGGFNVFENKKLSYYVGKILVFEYKDSKGILYLQNALKLDSKNKKLKKELEEGYDIIGFKNRDWR